MHTLKCFEECPEFPADILIVDIPTISYLKLQNDSAKESENLYKANREHGFLLLDLNNCEEGKQLLEDAEIIYNISIDIFNFGPETSINYKLNIPKDPSLALGTLSVLSPLEKPSATSLRLLMTPPQPLDDKIVSLGGHTDIGTIVMLFHVVGGFQVLPAGCENISSNWPYVRSVRGCALINIVDSLVEWTGGLLRSNLHRVVTPPGKQATCTRRNLAYLIRPDHNGSMRRLQINGISQLAEDEEVETCSVDEWAAWRAQ
ncbi:hypothetical protein BGAL_0676g00010 [Botrytis galanthina]|uniref:Isopenicillin N synthase-like Fe(2+) 2OG dioxygenase domain-containing protein n=1 Tax=Botrytis galanthina TaxID=278940 RepID=A0A4S8QUD8_9HELO|nr:hypothetical protein BGAL_0676g00010 [Botrytis galanthina]